MFQNKFDFLPVFACIDYLFSNYNNNWLINYGVFDTIWNKFQTEGPTTPLKILFSR